ncbi:flavodoxin [Paraflavitalea sp. CAU 1676]|uniref:flavodoxin n=1 Tax=Paraflavitalea sp. CAU 1676 TaxID=3032598 RepID=UPI0023DAF7C3|nr:flavodoxin [Paraflavitalea sp. CAU 1676]MDF2187974.1 flavodoxin [Paraflavitalea sp. CAU 1676]
MKKFSTSLWLLTVAAILLAECSKAQQVSSDGKILIVYLSRTNNTKAIAEIIHKNMGGDLVALELQNPYPANYQQTVQQVVRENESGYLPPLKTKIDSIEKYNIVFVGFPTWGMKLPPPMKTFLHQYDLSGKTIAPFNTNGGYGIGSSFDTVKELCPNSKVVEGFSMEGGSERDGKLLTIQGEKATQAESLVKAWLKRINLLPTAALTPRQVSIVPIAAATATGNQTLLRSALNDGLEAGLSMNETKEILVQLYAYAGFPRSLNAINTLQAVANERKQAGKKDVAGKMPSAVAYNQGRFAFGKEVQTTLTGTTAIGEPQRYVPVIDTFLKEHLFADIFSRDNLDYQSREIATISALASMSGTEGQLRGHLNVGRNVGLTEQQLRAIAFTISTRVGWQEGNTMTKNINEMYRTQDAAVASTANGVTVKKVTFPNENISVVGNLYMPQGFDKNRKYPAILVGHPAGGVKEQTAGIYAQKLAEQGFITLAFDASYQGESGGYPRFLEDPAMRVEDFRAATDYLSTHPSIDPNRIGVLGICAGGGFAIKAAETERRLKAVATVSMVDLGQLRREGLAGVLKPQMQQRLEEVGRQRTREANGEPIKYVNYVFNTREEIPASATGMYKEGYDYYRTSRGQHPNSQNKYAFTSLDKLMNFTALDHVEMIAPRPLLLIVGNQADSKYFSDDAFNRAAQPKELFEVSGASHIDMYDKPEYVPQAVKKLTDFFTQHLK